MNFITDSKTLFFGTRLKRLSTRFHKDIVKIYAMHNIKFEISWFPVFYLLKSNEQMSVTSMAKAMDVSHPSIHQILRSLENEGIILITLDQNDRRKKCVSFTKEGKQVMQQVEPIWNRIQEQMELILKVHPATEILMEALTLVETELTETSLFDRVVSKQSE